MKRRIIVSIVFLAMFASLLSFATACGQKGTVVNSAEEAYAIMVGDCLKFETKSTFKVSFDPNDIKYEDFRIALKEKDPFVDGCLYSYRWDFKRKGQYYEATIKYKFYINNSQYRQVCTIAKDIAKCLKGKSDYEKIKGAHDFLIEQNNYHIGSDGPYRALYKGQTNCNGYALSFMKIMQECGIQCTYETGDNHAWNSVCLDQEWYNIDVCWDDSGVWDKEGGTRYEYFLKSDGDWEKHHHGSATAKESYPADLDLKVKIKDFDMIYTIRNWVIVIATIVGIILVKAILNKRKKNKNRKAFASQEQSSFTKYQNGTYLKDINKQADDIVLG